MYSLQAFPFLKRCIDRGERTALVTVSAVTGGSTRDPGTHMAVSETGEFWGSLSGGCIEAAVVAEAQHVIAEGRPRSCRFGAGSPFIDIRLPCGGSINLLMTPILDANPVNLAVSLLAKRMPIYLQLQDVPPFFAVSPSGEKVSSGDHFMRVRHLPDLRLAIFGQGEAVPALATLAKSHGCEVHLFVPDERTYLAGLACGAATTRLGATAMPDSFVSDGWTANIFMFHDHDWEAPLMCAALSAPHFYLGAMGSMKTHEARCHALRTLGVPDSELARIKAPIGLIPSSRDPATLAISTLAEVVANYNALEPCKRL